MAMQQSGKGASGSGANPALTDEQADQLAASFTPAWATDDGADFGSTSIDAAPAGAIANPDAKPTVSTQPGVAPPAPAPVAAAPAAASSLHKNTVIGMQAPMAPPTTRETSPSTEAIDPANVLEVKPAAPPIKSTPPPAPQVAKAPGPNGPTEKTQPLMRTQQMAQAPARNRAPFPPPAATRNGASNVSADPFASSAADSDQFPVPKKSKAIYVVVGLVLVAGVGIGLKLGLSSDAPKTATTTQAAPPPPPSKEDIPPPPPKDEVPPATAAAKTPTPPSTVAATPPTPPPPAPPPAVAAAPQVHAAATPAAHPPSGGGAVRPRNPPPPPPPMGAAPPPPPAAAPKTAPKGPQGGIVRDSPF